MTNASASFSQVVYAFVPQNLQLLCAASEVSMGGIVPPDVGQRAQRGNVSLIESEIHAGCDAAAEVPADLETRSVDSTLIIEALPIDIQSLVTNSAVYNPHQSVPDPLIQIFKPSGCAGGTAFTVLVPEFPAVSGAVSSVKSLIQRQAASKTRNSWILSGVFFVMFCAVFVLFELNRVQARETGIQRVVSTAGIPEETVRTPGNISDHESPYDQRSATVSGSARRETLRFTIPTHHLTPETLNQFMSRSTVETVDSQSPAQVITSRRQQRLLISSPTSPQSSPIKKVAMQSDFPFFRKPAQRIRISGERADALPQHEIGASIRIPALMMKDTQVKPDWQMPPLPTDLVDVRLR